MTKQPALDTPLCFVHLQKTGGTSLSRCLASALRDHPVFLDLDVNDLEQTILSGASGVLYAGHFWRSLRHILPSDTRYITVLREPTSRIISAFHHDQRQRRFEGTPDEELGRLPFEEAVFHPHLTNYYWNAQAIHLAAHSKSWQGNQVRDKLKDSRAIEEYFASVHSRLWTTLPALE
jgi:hypothetical protein